MTGHVFHPGHEELHGVTVVVRGSAGGRTYLGRYHERGPRGVILHDAGVHDPASEGTPLDEWLAKQRKFGIRISHRTLVVPESEVGTITRFSDL